MTNLKGRVLRDAAEAYIKVSRIGATDPSAKIDEYAHFLDQQRETLPAELLDGVFVSPRISLRDVFEIIHAIEDARYWKAQYENTWNSQEEWIGRWRSAIIILKDSKQGLWNNRARNALRALGLIMPKTKRKKHNYSQLKWRYYQLIEGYFDPATETHHRPLSPSKAIEKMTLEFPAFDGKDSWEACRKALYRAGVRNPPTDK